MNPYNLIKMIGLKVFIASDHGGFERKGEIFAFLKNALVQVEDLGHFNADSVDYPDYALPLCLKVLNEPGSFGILLCGTGIGMSIAANKVKGIRAALCNETVSAKLAREHNQANVLCLGARLIGPIMAQEIVTTFLNAHFEGGRHIPRVQKIQKIEENTL